MSLANSPAYKKALAKTASIFEESGVGQTERGTQASIDTTRQLNSLLFLVLKLNDKVQALQEEVQDIRKRIRRLEKAEVSASLLYDAELDDIIGQLSRLQTIKGAAPRKRLGERGRLKVYQDPYEILRKLKQ
uniref:Uncharacterized protein n=1 Tax=Pineapple bacilliform CO virus TaxID=2033633 RepID=G0T3E7_9VIRU|nr:hypothetical protein [Pineapple bacilliform CO virus]